MSEDGLHFVAGPPVIPPGTWGDKLEVGAVAKLGAHYYMLVGQAEVPLGLRWALHNSRGMGGMYVLRAEHQEGPFTLGPRQAPLLVSAPRHYTYFARFYDNNGETLVCHHSISPARDIANIRPKPGTSFAPLKKVVVNDGALELAWWPGNTALLGPELPIDLRAVRGRGLSSAPESADDNLYLEACAGGTAVLPYRYDLDRGTVVEVSTKVDRAYAPNHGVGLFIEGETAWSGTVVLVDQAGTLSVGPYNGYGFQADDTKAGSVTNLSKPAKWRMLVRKRFVEVYLDDRLLQCYTLGHRSGGRLGCVVESCRASFSQLRVCEMRI